MAHREGQYTIILDNAPSIEGYAAVVSKKESEGPLAEYFDLICEDSTFGEKTWEKAESRMQKDAVSKALSKASLSATCLNYIFAGDLLNQCIGSTYGLRDLGVPFIGLYGACSTMAESLGMASLFVDSDMANYTCAVTSSHFCSAERQFRFPLEYGGQRTPTSQWTVTGSGACIIGKQQKPPYVRSVTFGTIEDKGINDLSNMGAAMAPAAAETIARFFSDTNTNPADYDLILTGDLGYIGSELLYTLMQEKGIKMEKRHNDCGILIYDKETQDTHAGGSGCGCSASVLTGYILKQVEKGELNNVLFVATGALMSTISVQQGETIPAVAHLIHISNKPK